MKNPVFEIKNWLDGINGSVDIAKEKMHAFRILAIETKMEDRKRIKKKLNRASSSCGTASGLNICGVGVPQREKTKSV